MKKYKVGDILICKLSNDKYLEFGQLLEIETVRGDVVPIYTFKGHTITYTQGVINRIFKLYKSA